MRGEPCCFPGPCAWQGMSGMSGRAEQVWSCVVWAGAASGGSFGGRPAEHEGSGRQPVCEVALLGEWLAVHGRAGVHSCGHLSCAAVPG
eukprot:10792686-Alexandrium_andersonii.AAC.1